MAHEEKRERFDGDMPPLVERVHAKPIIIGESPNTPFNESVVDVLHSRKKIEGSVFANHISRLRERLYGAAARDEAPIPWSFDPQGARRVIRDDPRALGEEFEERTRECSEMIENGCTLLEHIHRLRTQGADAGVSPGTGPAWRVNVSGEDGLVQELLDRAKAGANRGLSTKASGVSGCAHPLWIQLMDEYGLRGAAAYPIFAVGVWISGLSSGEFDDWRQDFIVTLIYGFYLEYNLDAFEDPRGRHFLRDLTCMWDVPDLPAELRARRTHLLAQLAYVDAKRRSEAALRSVPTNGLMAWAFRDRDAWRDFKACDSSMFGHLLSSVPGNRGRDDLMLTGLTQDWADLGPDLRNGECAQSVLTLTRGSLSAASLITCYERTVWMLNALLTADAGVQRSRSSLMITCMDINVWNSGAHRHDVWRYFTLAADACAWVQERDLYKSCQLEDCYTRDFEPTLPRGSSRVTVRRRSLPYSVTVHGRRFSGAVELHTVVADAVVRGLLPREYVEYQYVIPKLYIGKALTPSEFISHMDRVYCEQSATIMRAALQADFSEAFATALILFVMEQWWAGFNLAFGVGSLIEAQPGHTANDRVHPER
ncbi:hypothetical protein SAMN05443572_107194 [Myxococcus fulvus]|uniref:Uncharacterized protein n=1 Tax=Myxococcus fulvus TaxID=33 RepID=A0A511T6V0_MYXFU|nr:hypothetical protein [Myxococcus fulvus]GEN09900.1 hypothetical protein MFU01_49370 [Myxococcus fulvus]SEU26033.1 hypothetical protein SAMN05443572_107194 [Myxococcus fulvus]